MILCLFLAACAGRPPLDRSRVDTTLTPEKVLADPQAAVGRTVEWGGVIVSTTNLKDSTQIEVVGYPLDRTDRPDSSTKPQGRFLLTHKGYLESAVYGQGRVVTVVGPVTETKKGRIGEADYTYPVVSAEQLHIWPRERGYTEPMIHFGIGVIF
jgi:outer membrane lipoprotein